MRPLEITIEISPVDLAPWNGAAVPIRFVWTETEITVTFPPSPHLSPEILKRLRVRYAEIASSLTKQSREILWFLLNAPGGQATREELMRNVWPDKVPTWGTVRQAVIRLRVALTQVKFDYVVSSNRSGVFYIVPMANETHALQGWM